MCVWSGYSIAPFLSMNARTEVESETTNDMELPVEVCDQLRRTGGELIRQSGAEGPIVGACAVHTGIQLMLRDFDPEQVAAWLEEEALALRDFGHTP